MRASAPSREKKGKPAVIRPLEALSNGLKANIVSAMQRGLDPVRDSGLFTSAIRERALALIHDKVVTVAALAKVVLVALHPTLSDDQKRGALPTAALAYAATDTDALTDGERRLLGSIVRLYTRQRWVGCDADGAKRAVQFSTAKKDVVEILLVLFNQGARAAGNDVAAPVPPGSGGGGGGSRNRSLPVLGGGGGGGGGGRGRRAHGRGEVCLDPNPRANAGRRKGATKKRAAKGGGGRRSPTPPAPGAGMSAASPRVRNSGLKSVRSLEYLSARPEKSQPPRALGQYQGVDTMWNIREATPMR